MAASLQMHLSKIRSPSEGEKVYKDECMFSFDTPECETGLYICMNTFMGFGRDHVKSYYEKTGNAVYLHMCRIKRQLPKVEDDAGKPKPTKLAIGVEGGFNLDENKYEVEEVNTIIVMPSWKDIPLTDSELPVEVQISAAAIIATNSAAHQEELQALSGAWDGEKRVISRHAETLVQLPRSGRKIAPSGWKCEQCDLTENLWLNLTDGSILCGRKFWDGSGGNNHAVEHYEQAKHPLAVKLGTITPDGADVYSYDEDDMVEDPYLAKHLAHFGIDIMSMQKTEKTMVELEIDLNQKIGEWDVIQEAGSKLQPVHGPGYTGMVNLGNSCYMNSVMQVVFTLPDFQHKYFAQYDSVMARGLADPAGDFTVQMTKLAYGLLSGKYSKESPVNTDLKEPTIIRPHGIKPQMFKTLIGRGHPEFSTKRQQDAQEFILHLLNMTDRNSHGQENPTECLRFKLEERIECVQSKKVHYVTKEEYMLALPIPLDAASNKEQRLH
ncbi:hypothetical protein NP493_5g12009 [Ridgeia piscesae]|uniref:ubiquitinyl hydrolase 1 n=1 Tax=Ridgeia piscesae TaxID=27915 RepID=A0AAD9PFE5_RIDPI|nr:hypothetical protein NP493_5g12009 [Ridgeia piscesae]